MNARGVALLMGLLLLAALSLLAAMAANGMVLQRRITANSAAAREALQHAVLAEAQARAWLFSRGDSERERDCAVGCLLPVAIRQAGELPYDPQFESAAWWQANGVQAGTDPADGHTLDPAEGDLLPAWWVLGEIHYEASPPESAEPVAGGIGYYRLIARGESTQPGSVAVTESLLARPWEGDFALAEFPPGQAPGSFCRQFEPRLTCGPLAWRQLR